MSLAGNHVFNSLAVASDGSIVAGGVKGWNVLTDTTPLQMAVVRLSADGVVDTAFGPNGTGYSYAQVGPGTQGWTNLALDPLTGDVVLGGEIRKAERGGAFIGPAMVRFGHP